MQIKWLKPCHLDGLLFVGIAFFTTGLQCLADSDTAQFMSPVILWCMKKAMIVACAVCVALKAYRSTDYGDQKRKDHASEAKTQAVTDAAIVRSEKILNEAATSGTIVTTTPPTVTTVTTVTTDKTP